MSVVSSSPAARQVSSPSPSAFPDPIPGIIRFGSINLWSGASGVGKTIMLAEWFARMRDGRSIWGKPTNRPTAFYVLAADRDWSTYAEAFADAGFPDVPHYVLAEDDTERPHAWQKEASIALYDRCLAKLAPIPGSLLFVDPFSPLFILGDQNRPRDCAITLHSIRRRSRQHQITQILSSNTIKISAKPGEGYQRSRDNISGSGALVAYSDTSIYTQPPAEEGGPTLLGWAPRRAKEETFQCQFDPDTRLFIPYSGIAEVGETSETDRPSIVLSALPLDYSALERQVWRALAQEALRARRQVPSPKDPLPLSNFKRDITTLKERGLVIQDGWGRYARRKLQ